MQELSHRRKSKQRGLIFEIVRSLKSHPTAEEVYEIARLTMPAVSLGTIYRNLRLLADSGDIHEVQFETGPARFDGMTEEHEHFICTKCGAMRDISPTPAMKYAAATHPDLIGHSINGYKLSFNGICSECNKNHS